MVTALTIPPAEMAAYRATARRRQESQQRALAWRQERAWDLARRAAALLKASFSATRVVVFGSLVHAGCFTPWSDVDIAAWGLASKDTLRAIGAVMDLDADIEVNLVDTGTCRPELLMTIKQEGIEL
jgi:uncharacterized protein